MATEKVNVLITGEDQASQKVDRVSKSVDELGKEYEQTAQKVGTSFSRMSKSLDSFGAKATKLGKTMSLRVTAPIIALGALTIKTAADFEQGMSNISTVLDTTVEDMKAMGDQVLEISRRTPVALNDLTLALYDVRSAGISAADAMMVLERAAQLGVAGLGTTQEAVNVATSAINAFQFEGEQAAKVFDVLMLTVRSGKTTIAELAQGFGGVAGLAKETGVRFEELMAVTAAMTATGLKASMAYSSIKQVIANVAKPTAEAIDLAKKLGVEFNTSSLRAKGLAKFMGDLAIAVDGDKDAIIELFGSVEAMNTALSLTGANAENFTSILKDMENPTGVLSEAFAKQSETFKAHWQIMKNNLSVVMNTLGASILPDLAKAMTKVSEVVSNMNPRTVKVVATLALLAATIGPLLVVLGMMATGLGAVISGLTTVIPLAISAGTAFTTMLGPIGLIIIALGVAVKGIQNLSSEFKAGMDKSSEALREFSIETTDTLNSTQKEHRSHIQVVLGLEKELLDARKAGNVELVEDRKKVLAELLLEEKKSANQRMAVIIKEMKDRLDLRVELVRDIRAMEKIGSMTGPIGKKFFEKDLKQKQFELGLTEQLVGKLGKTLKQMEFDMQQEELALQFEGVDVNKITNTENSIKKIGETSKTTTKELDKLAKETQALAEKSQKALDSLTIAHTKYAEKSKSEIDSLKEKLKELRDSYRENLDGINKNIGESIVEQENKIKRLKEALESATDVKEKKKISTELTAEESALEGFLKTLPEESKKVGILRREIEALQSTLSRTSKFRESANERSSLESSIAEKKKEMDALLAADNNYRKEIEEARRRDALTDFERSIEDFKKKAELLEQEKNKQSEIINSKISKLGEERAKEQELFDLKRNEHLQTLQLTLGGVAQQKEAQTDYYSTLGENMNKTADETQSMTSGIVAENTLQQQSATLTATVHKAMVTAIQQANTSLAESMALTANKAEQAYERIRAAVQRIKSITAPKEGPDTRTLSDVGRAYVQDQTAGSFISKPVALGVPRSNNTSNTNNRTTQNQTNNITVKVENNAKPNDIATAIARMIQVQNFNTA